MRILLITALLPLSACHASWDKDGAEQSKASGPATTRSYQAADFTGVELRGSDDVKVQVGPAFSVKATGSADVLDNLEITVVNGTLRIDRKDGKNWSFGNDKGATIHVTMPTIGAASVSGSGDMDVDRAQGDFKAAIGGSGDLDVASIAGGVLDLAIAGSGDMKVAGTATKVSASVAGSGDVDFGGLTASTASVSIAGSGSVRGKVTGDANVSIVGSGDVELTGGAKCKVTSIGSGEARCG